jgi:Caspase domain/Pentapeptide repeats (8 copies)
MARYALVIGITQNHQSLQTLEKSAADARAIADVLRDFGDFQVELLIKPEDTTYKALEAKLLEFFEQRALRQEAVIYYTGHGFQHKGTFGKKEAFLAPSDCVVELDADGQVVRQQKGLSLTAVNALAAAAELSNLVMLLDCCHSGYLLEESLLKDTFSSFSQKDYWLMTACRSFQSAYAKKKEPYSIFTSAVLAGLKRDRSNDRGEITAGALFNYVAEALRGERQEVMQLSVGRQTWLVRYPLSKPEPVVTVDETNPYQSLNAFTPETAKYFFGREPEIQKLVQQVQDCNFVPVIGASGSGKSSLVRAGLIPRLVELEWRVLEPIKPGVEPLVTLKLAVGDLFETAEREEIYGVLDRQGLGAIASHLPGNDRVILVVDQFEEVFTLCQDRQQQRRFIDCLTSVKQSENRRLVVVTTMRADFVEPWLTSGVLTQAIQNDALFLGVLAGENLEEAIEKPSIIQGYNLQPGLLDLILRDVANEDNCLPLLEFTLTELWEKRGRVKHELTIDEYKALGGLAGALDRHAEEIYQDLAARGQGEWVQRVMLRLVRTGEGIRDTRQRRSQAELLVMGTDAATREKIQKTIDRLVDGRLLTIDRVNDENVIDLSHEALMQGWKRFVKWRERDRDLRRLVDKIEEARREWQVQKQQRKYLLEGRLLGDAKRLLKDRSDSLLGDVRSFVIKSWDHQKRRRLQSVGWLIIPILVLGIPSEYFWREAVVRQNYISIRDSSADGTEEERVAVLNLAGGCWVDKSLILVPQYFRERMFGNCRSLDSTNLRGAKLDGANLSGTNLDSANLSFTKLNAVNLSGANLGSANLKNVTFDCSVESPCNDIKNIHWDEETNWAGIKGWKHVENIPPELKKQLKLP